jgi:hypothetical protein
MSRRSNKQVFCACSDCKEDVQYPLVGDSLAINKPRYCKCYIKKLNFACYLLRLCNDCQSRVVEEESEEESVEEGENMEEEEEEDEEAAEVVIVKESVEEGENVGEEKEQEEAIVAANEEAEVAADEVVNLMSDLEEEEDEDEVRVRFRDSLPISHTGIDTASRAHIDTGQWMLVEASDGSDIDWNCVNASDRDEDTEFEWEKDAGFVPEEYIDGNFVTRDKTKEELEVERTFFAAQFTQIACTSAEKSKLARARAVPKPQWTGKVSTVNRTSGARNTSDLKTLSAKQVFDNTKKLLSLSGLEIETLGLTLQANVLFCSPCQREVGTKASVIYSHLGLKKLKNGAFITKNEERLNDHQKKQRAWNERKTEQCSIAKFIDNVYMMTPASDPIDMDTLNEAEKVIASQGRSLSKELLQNRIELCRALVEEGICLSILKNPLGALIHSYTYCTA